MRVRSLQVCAALAAGQRVRQLTVQDRWARELAVQHERQQHMKLLREHLLPYVKVRMQSHSPSPPAKRMLPPLASREGSPGAVAPLQQHRSPDGRDEVSSAIRWSNRNPVFGLI